MPRGKAASVRALDKLTGKEVWKAEAERLDLCFGTPMLVDCEGGRTDLVLAVPGEVVGTESRHRQAALVRGDGH